MKCLKPVFLIPGSSYMARNSESVIEILIYVLINTNATHA